MSNFDVVYTTTNSPFRGSAAVVDKPALLATFSSHQEAREYVKEQILLEGDEISGSYTIYERNA